MNRFINQFQVSGDNKELLWTLRIYTTFNAVKYFEHIQVKESREQGMMLRICCTSYINMSLSSMTSANEMLLLEMLQDGEDSHLDYVEKSNPQP